LRTADAVASRSQGFDPMSDVIDAVFWVTMAVLWASKLPDLWTTARHVGIEGEMNPIGRCLLRRLGLFPGLVVAGLVHTLAVGTFAVLCWASYGALGRGTFALLALAVAVAHIDVARFNATRRHSWFTRVVGRVYAEWRRRWS
jgi:hypothetical protein